jgi:uncharacterized protein YlxW (UPF0749 family)
MDKINWMRAGFMLGTGVLMGSLFAFQSKSVSQANIYYNRESRISIFKEIQIVKKSTQNLSDQVNELEKELIVSSNKELALSNIKKEIEKYQVLSGELTAKGQGIKVDISGELETLWFTDLINELFSAGAEAISINGIRLNPLNAGFDTLPNGQILFGGEILRAPFHLEAIGDMKNLAGSIKQSGGIIARIQSYKPEYQIKVGESKELLLPAMK